MTGPTPESAISRFEELVGLAPEERAGRLRELEARAPAVAARVRRMFAADRGTPLKRGDLLAAAAGSLDEGARIGPYRVVRELGRGGMGVVYLAERADGAFERAVAIKLVRTLGADADQVRRFELERRLLARLEHPGITRILDGGVTWRGAPYLVMEHVEGEPLTAYCDRLRLSVRRRLELLRSVCEPLLYAHCALIVHRDLKPANILITHQGRPKLLDFGIAKLMEPGLEVGSTLTLVGSRPFTPEYASPEQILGEPISTASDVYSLGVVLYELLVGEVPLRLENPVPGELVRAAERRHTQLPSRRFAQLGTEDGAHRATLRGTQRKALERELTGDLDRILAKALDPDPDLRYASVDQLSEDLRRHLEGLPVRARPATLGYRARKFVRRNRGLVTVTSLIALLVLGGFGCALWQRGVAVEARHRAELEAMRMQSTSRFLVSLFQSGSTRPLLERAHKGPQTPILDVLDEASQRLDQDLTTGPVELSDLHHALGDAFLSIGLRERAAVHLERSLELRRSALGELDEDTARAWYYAASAAPTLAEAIEKFRRSVAIEERLARPSTNYPWALADLAGALTHDGRFAEAAERLEAARAVTRTLPAGHAARFNRLMREIDLAISRGDLAGAKSLLGATGELVPFDRPYERAFIAGARGRIAWLEGDIQGAVRFLRAARRLSGAPDSDARFTDAPLLAAALARAGELDEAERLAAALRAEEPARDPTYWDAAGLTALAVVDLAQGRAAGCERRARAAVEVLEQGVARPTLRLAEARETLGECLLAAGRPAEAAAPLAASHNGLADLYGPQLAETRRVGDLLRRARATGAR